MQNFWRRMNVCNSPKSFRFERKLLSHSCNVQIVQGSGLGPLMFLICMNKRIEIFIQYKMTVKLFVDHVRMYAKIVNSVDSNELQWKAAAINFYCKILYFKLWVG